MRAVFVGHIPVGCSPMSYFLAFFKQARPSPRWVWSVGVKWKPRTLIRSMKNGPRLLTKYNKTHPYLTLWLDFDFWCLPAFLVLQREFHYFINTVLSDSGMIVSCTKRHVKLVATSQRMMKSGFQTFPLPIPAEPLEVNPRTFFNRTLTKKTVIKSNFDWFRLGSMVEVGIHSIKK